MRGLATSSRKSFNSNGFGHETRNDHAAVSVKKSGSNFSFHKSFELNDFSDEGVIRIRPDLSFLTAPGRRRERCTATLLLDTQPLDPARCMLTAEPDHVCGQEGLNPNLESQNPNPHTPNTKPQTQNPKPQSLNPKPQTLNPKPYTLHPTQ